MVQLIYIYPFYVGFSYIAIFENPDSFQNGTKLSFSVSGIVITEKLCFVPF